MFATLPTKLLDESWDTLSTIHNTSTLKYLPLNRVHYSIGYSNDVTKSKIDNSVAYTTIDYGRIVSGR